MPLSAPAAAPTRVPENEVEELHSRYLELAADSRFDEGRPLLWKAIRLGRERAELSRAVFVARLSLARDHVRLGEVTQAFGSLRQLRAIAEESGDEALLLQLQATEAQLLLDLGRVDDTLRYGSAVLARLRPYPSPSSPSEVADLLVAMADAALEKGDVVQAGAFLEAGPGGRDRTTGDVASSVVARLDTVLGDLADVESRLRTRLGDERGTLEGRMRLLCALVEAQLWSNQPVAAVSALRGEWPAVLGAGPNNPAVLRVLTLAMRACADLRHHARLSGRRDLETVAGQAAAEARRAADTLNLAEVVMHCPRVTARVESWEWHAEAARFSQDSGAGGGWRSIAERWRELGRPHRASYARLREAQALSRTGDDVGAERALRQALDAAGTHVPLHRAIDAVAHATERGALSTRAPFSTPPGTTTTSPERVDSPTVGITDKAPRPRLTGREREVMDLIAAGNTAVSAGHRLGISSRTVSKHLEHIYSKLDCDNRIAALVRLRE